MIEDAETADRIAAKAPAPARARKAKSTPKRQTRQQAGARKAAAPAVPAKPLTTRRKPLAAGPQDKALWGLKHICPACDSRYYDLKKTGAKCPSCGADRPQAKLVASGNPVRRTRSSFGRYR